MARKTLTCKPVPELEIQTESGENIILRFDVYSVAELQECDEEGIGGLIKKSFPELAAAIIYSSGRKLNDGLSIEKAREMVSCMSVDDISCIIEEFSDAIGADIKAQSEENSKNLMAQFLNHTK